MKKFSSAVRNRLLAAMYALLCVGALALGGIIIKISLTAPANVKEQNTFEPDIAESTSITESDESLSTLESPADGIEQNASEPTVIENTGIEFNVRSSDDKPESTSTEIRKFIVTDIGEAGPLKRAKSYFSESMSTLEPPADE